MLVVIMKLVKREFVLLFSYKYQHVAVYNKKCILAIDWLQECYYSTFMNVERSENMKHVTHHIYLYQEPGYREVCRCDYLAAKFDEYIRENAAFPPYVACVYAVYSDGSRERVDMDAYVKETLEDAEYPYERQVADEWDHGRL